MSEIASEAPASAPTPVERQSDPEPEAKPVQEPIERPKFKRPSAGKTMAIPTDLNSLKASMQKPEDEEKEDEPQVVGAVRDTAFTPEQLAESWQQFVAKRQELGLQQELLILKEPYSVEDKHITVPIANEALEPTFERFRADLLLFLRDSLQNDHISLSSEIREIEKGKMLYTDREKFEHLKKKYPALKDLQEKLGLDPEF
ncbi:MAG: hypothetical protein HWE07_11600 [Cytophagia bacterium]|nr:hypothetical protein [Cytophagia bacterium]